LRAKGVAVSNVAELREIFDLNWPGVEEWIEEVKPYLNRAIDAMWAVFDPAAIVFGGELPRNLGERLIELPFSERYWRTGIAAVEPKRVLSNVDGDPAVIGAALIPLKELYFV
jgi:predicted NBD/HSP70 family sugar kinase